MTEDTFVYITVKQLAERYNVTKNTIWTWVRQGKVPKPKRLSDRVVRFWLPEIIEHEQKQGLQSKDD